MGNEPEKQTSRYYISRHHRVASDLLLKRMEEFQNKPDNYKSTAALCVALITSAVSYIECKINEFISGLIEFGPYEQYISPEQKTLIVSIAQTFDWKYKLSILEKYQFALSTLSKDLFEKGKEPYQSANILIQFRNHLVHYEPINTVVSTTLGEREFIPKLEERIYQKIGNTPFKGLKDFFPENCFHYACGKWAVSSSNEFVEAFLLRFGAKLNEFIMTGFSE